MVAQTYYSGAGIIGRVLRHQRDKINRSGRRLRLRDIADLAGYDSASNISWIERGFARVTSEHVRGIAKAYELDEELFWMLWVVGRLIDEHTPTKVLRRLLDGGDLGSEGLPETNGPAGDISPSGGGTHVPPFERGNRQDIEWAIKALRQLVGYESDDATKSSRVGILIRNRSLIMDRIKDAKSLIFLYAINLVFPEMVILES